MDGVWAIAADKSFCAVTGLPTKEVFKALYACGLEKSDFRRIENLDSSSEYVFQDRFAVAAWMDRQADELERRRSSAK